MKTSSVLLFLGKVLPFVRTCLHAKDSGARPPVESSMVVRRSTCPGQMVRPVEKTCGACGQNVSIRAVGGGRLWMEDGASGRGDGIITCR